MAARHPVESQARPAAVLPANLHAGPMIPRFLLLLNRQLIRQGAQPLHVSF